MWAKLRQSRPWFLLALGLAYVAACAFFYGMIWPVQPSPDEHAMVVFSQYWAENNTFRIPQPIVDDLVRPRSVNISEQFFVPGLFLGYPLMLGVGYRLVGPTVFGLLPALLAIAGLWAWYTIWATIFDKRLAWRAMVLAALFPPILHYSLRGLFPNLAFLELAALGVALFLLAAKSLAKTNTIIMAVAAGLCAGFSVIIRPVEWLWLGPCLFVLWICYRRAISWKQLILTGLASLPPLLWNLYWQRQTYQALLKTGYDSLSSASAPAVAGVNLWSRLLFPFGFHPWDALLRLANLTGALYWYVLPFFLIGLIFSFRFLQKSGEQKKYSIVFYVVSTYLILFYGSWAVSDSIDKNSISLGLSYNRYWLPVFFLAMPYVVWGLDSVGQWLSQRVHRFLTPSFLLATLGVICLLQTALVDRESIRFMITNGVEYKELQTWVFSQTVKDSVVLTTRHDKILWPERQVVVLSDDVHELTTPWAPLLGQHPLYWLTELPPSQAQEIEQRDLAPQKLRLQLIGTHDTFSLYGLVPHP